MYNETLEILMEGINDPVKETILKNQLSYHFNNKILANKNVIDNSIVIVRRIINNFNIDNIIGIQPVTNKEKPNIISNGHEYNIDVTTRSLQCVFPNINDTKYLEAEINEAVAAEIEIEIVNEILKAISDNITDNLIINVSFTSSESIRDLNNTLINEIKKVDGNWIVVSPVALTLLQADHESKYKSAGEKHGTMGGLLPVGLLDENVAVYCNLWMDDMILIGSKIHNKEDTPIVYAPETMVVVGIEENHNENSHFPLLTKGATFVNMDTVKERYRKILIKIENND